MSWPRHRGATFDHHALNEKARAAFRPQAAPFPLLIVPGYTPRLGWARGLHPKNTARLARALHDLQAGAAPTVLVSGGDVHSPDNEALLMREWLLDAGVREEQVLVEPHARHSTTNLRNAGRLMLELGAREALIVSDDDDWPRRFAQQSYYFGYPWISSYHLRCWLELGYTVGELDWLGPGHVRYRPSPAVLRRARFE